MNISHHHGVGNSSRVAPASDTNQSKYLTPDYYNGLKNQDKIFEQFAW